MLSTVGSQTRAFARSALLGVLLAQGAYACAELDASEAQGSALTIDDVQGELSPGARGAEVGAIYRYLRDFGYFPNAALEASFPHWLPVVADEPEDASYYGDELERAVSAYQQQYGLERTGRVDAATLAAMQAPRCGHPDNELAGLDESEKWAIMSDLVYAATNVRWGVSMLNPYATEPVTNNAILAAFNSWQPVTNRTFSFSVGTKEINIKFCPNTKPPATGCVTFSPGSLALGGFGGIMFNASDYSWETAEKIQRTAVHEIGHTLGLAHAVANTSVMYPAELVHPLTPSADDLHGIEVKYNSWELVNGLALDVGVGGTASNSAVWVTSGGNTIWKFNTSTQAFQQQFVDNSANGVSIAVSSSRIPWVVTTGNQIKRRNCEGIGDCPNVTDWSTVGNGRDIGIGGSPERIWAIGTTAQGDAGNFQVLRWNGFAFVAPSGGGFGVRVTVDSTGRPWVAQANGNIFRRNANDNGWDQMPGKARDLGAGSAGSVYAIEFSGGSNGEFPISSWDEQGANPCPSMPVDPPCRRTWVRMDGAANRIAGSPVLPGTLGNGRGSIWAVQSSAAIFRRISKPQ